MNSIQCPTCGSHRLKPYNDAQFYVSEASWDRCSCSDATTCLAHRFDPDSFPDRPSEDVLLEKAQKRMEEKVSEFEELKVKFERAEQMEAAFRDFVDKCELVNNHHNHALLVDAYRVLNKSSKG